MKLVDTSAWIEQLRRNGDMVVRARVEALLSEGEAAWCPIVRLELWNGARGELERRVLREMETELVSLKIDEPVWNRAIAMASAARTRGISVPSTDLLVAACAQHYGVALEHADSHFDLIAAI
jgi:predicted nucleic acid-binding protein